MIVIGVGEQFPRIADFRREIQIESLVADHKDTYSASQVEVAMMVCFLDLQNTAPL